MMTKAKSSLSGKKAAAEKKPFAYVPRGFALVRDGSGAWTLRLKPDWKIIPDVAFGWDVARKSPAEMERERPHLHLAVDNVPEASLQACR